MSIGSLSAGPSCEAGKLIVQIIGKDHEASQKLVLTSADDARTYPSLPQTLESEQGSCVLEVWDHVTGAQLELEVATTEGTPIRLPLLNGTSVTPRQADAQFNQVVPVLPFVALPGSKSAYDLGTPVLARAGYIYVFYRQTLWRELEVRIAESATTYHDVDVARFRQRDGFKPGERRAIGAALDDIWLPAAWNNQRVLDIQLCFSEIQLSAPRLERLEQDAASRAKRCTRPDLGYSKERAHRLYKGQPDGHTMLKAFADFDAHDQVAQRMLAPIMAARLGLEQSIFPVSLAAPQRARQPGFERLLDHPALYLCDLSGQFPVKALEQANAFLAEAGQGRTINDTCSLELSALADAMQASLPGDDDEPDDTSTCWQAQPSVSDVLNRARQRQICGVLLDDSSHRLRHLRQRIDTHQQLLEICARYAIQQPHHASALLVHQLIVPPTIGGSKNPLSAVITSLADTGRQAINRCTATVQRMLVGREMIGTQNLMVENLKRGVTLQTLADHLSLDGFKYVAALHDLSRTMTTLALTPSNVDPLAPGGTIVDALTGVGLWEPATSQGQTLLSQITNDSKHPLHLMLWPESDLETVCKPYEPPPDRDENLGDGRFRATELARFENAPAPNPVTQSTLDAALLANLLAGDSLQNFFLINTGKATTAALVGIFENLQGAVDAAENAVGKAEQALTSGKAEVASADIKNRSAFDQLAEIRDQPAPNARRIDVNRQGRGVQQLRSMMPKHFGAAFLLKRNQVTPQHYVFGLEDLPSRSTMPNARYGEYLDPDGNPFRDIDPPITLRGPLTSGEHLVLVIPRNHKTAQLISDVNRKLKAAQEAGHSVREAEQAYVRARSGLSQAIENLDATKNGPVYRFLRSTRFCVAVVMLEVWNVNSEVNALKQTTREKNSGRAHGGIAAAVLDLTIAAEALAIKLRSAQSKVAFTRKILLQISEANARRWIGLILGSVLTKKISLRIGAQILSAALLTGINLYDAYYAWQWNDPAMYGYLMMAAGGSAALLSSIFGGVAPVLGLHPLGWVALLLPGAGITQVLMQTLTPMETWLKNGPFGEAHPKNEHLQEPLEAFYRLISLLAGISITTEKNPVYEQQAKLDFRAEIPQAIRSANTIVRIESRLPGLIGRLDSLTINAECRLRSTRGRFDNQGMHRETHELSEQSERPKGQLLSPGRLELFFSTPENINATAWSSTTHNFTWAVRAQFILTIEGENRYLPAPPIKETTRYEQQWAKPDFEKTNQPFWADEIAHGAFPK
ncbi:hypothetical protein BZK31_10925 [Pseudomonas floridensis]|uniref:Uncharacterized protein n=1 Tax=Pseudomonas floridensis TaxID=1958950 RepID=A0A1X0N6K4_9PSED|nr:hypothetical protein [Pseudomonas floridensis]ORC59304.1 hypothetical protein BZK31_10925 [Pseudomonas floridensis]